MNFAQTAKNFTQIKTTENGAMAYSTTSNPLLDLFAQIGALRPRSEGEIEIKYADAYAVNPELATKMFFYAGNIRGGLGERRTFRNLCQSLGGKTAWDFMCEVLNDPMYDCVVI